MLQANVALAKQDIYKNVKDVNSHWLVCIRLLPADFGQGNIFTPVCHSVHRGGFLQIFGGSSKFSGGSSNFLGGLFGGGSSKFLGGSSTFSGGGLFLGGSSNFSQGGVFFGGVPQNFRGGSTKF